MAPPPRRTAWPGVRVIGPALALATVALYARVSAHDFVWYDDNEYVINNAVVRGGLTWSGFRWALSTMTMANWHPLTWLSHMADAQLYGLRAGWHHMTSGVLHAANAMVLFGVLRSLTGAVWRSAFVAALFAVHPLHVESVAWVAERKDVLSTFFGLLAMWAYVRYASCRALRWYAAVLCLFALSLLTKPMLVTLPFVFLLLDFWPLKRLALGRESLDPESKIHHPRISLILIEKMPLLAMSLASSVVTVIAQKRGGAVMPLEALPLTPRLENAAVAYAAYLGKMVWPVDLAVLYPLPNQWPVWKVAASVLVLVTISAIAIAFRRTRPSFLVGWLWYLGTLVPVIGLVQVGFHSMADRYTYVPLIGVFIMVAWSLPAVAAGGRLQWINGATAAAVLLALSARTWDQLGHWRDSFTLFPHALEVTRDNYIMHCNLGYAYSRERKFEEAERHYADSLRINESFALAHANLGGLLVERGRPEEAIGHLLRAVQLRPWLARPHNDLGAAYSQLLQLDAAITEYRESLRLDPQNAQAHSNLGRALVNRQKWQEAIAEIETALRLKPDFAEAHADLGVALAATGRLDDAIRQFQSALRLKPDFPYARSCLERALASQREQGAPR